MEARTRWIAASECSHASGELYRLGEICRSPTLLTSEGAGFKTPMLLYPFLPSIPQNDDASASVQ